jgi:hypothetical protein
MTKKIFKCKQCGKEFEDYISRRNYMDRFCSQTCSYNSKKGIKRPEEIGLKISKSKLKHPVSFETRKKLSKHFKGKTYEEIMGKELQRKHSLGKNNPFFNKTHSQESKEVMSEKKDGTNHWGWKDGDAYYRNKFRREVRKRDNYICMLCGIHQEKLSRALEVHHINYDKTLHFIENGVSLCSGCHHKPHNKFIDKKHWINLFQSLLFEKYGYQYSNNKIILPLEVK